MNHTRGAGGTIECREADRLKWEKGLSVPDSALLIKLAEILDVPVSRLLGSKIETEAKPDALAEQLSRINEQLAIKKGGQRECGKC